MIGMPNSAEITVCSVGFQPTMKLSGRNNRLGDDPGERVSIGTMHLATAKEWPRTNAPSRLAARVDRGKAGIRGILGVFP